MILPQEIIEQVRVGVTQRSQTKGIKLNMRARKLKKWCTLPRDVKSKTERKTSWA